MEFEEITKENTFWKLFKLTREIKTARDTFWVFLCSLAILFAFYSLRIDSLKDVETLIVSASDTVLTASVSLIGFIFAAYVLFASMTDKELMRIMALHKHPNYDMSYLKLGHCNFIKIILDLLMLVAIAYLGKILLPTFPEFDSITFYFTKLIYIFLLSVYQAGFILVLMLCKSAIFNVYHSIMMSTRWYAEEKVKEESPESDE
ncbi:hypothetical protein Patl_1733 [Paraglaciecola sp. T6c]|uniref:hypothetical protein n=1 Tax=Pseudoalteromonas atlantica (strain T6c / ATCC BAA-1087) TaxID=3042615 RepID=UPI00005C595F|nr:hypothetical protein [Paraglaciecola sp. T6c]ABG40254.1 hypothetical protein Patl_1733 [Paraglaciecola sp. T6c]